MDMACSARIHVQRCLGVSQAAKATSSEDREGVERHNKKSTYLHPIYQYISGVSILSGKQRAEELTVVDLSYRLRNKSRIAKPKNLLADYY